MKKTTFVIKLFSFKGAGSSGNYLFRVFHKRSFNSGSPYPVMDEIKTFGIFFGSSFCMADFNSSSSISLLLMAITKSFCSISLLPSEELLSTTMISIVSIISELKILPIQFFKKYLAL